MHITVRDGLWWPARRCCPYSFCCNIRYISARWVSNPPFWSICCSLSPQLGSLASLSSTCCARTGSVATTGSSVWLAIWSSLFCSSVPTPQMVMTYLPSPRGFTMPRWLVQWSISACSSIIQVSCGASSVACVWHWTAISTANVTVLSAGCAIVPCCCRSAPSLRRWSFSGRGPCSQSIL